MCTALRVCPGNHYFGRTLDLDQSYGERICVMPRRFPLAFQRCGSLKEHYAMMGMAVVAGDIPLYYDGVNEEGLCMAGLNFPGNAWYPPEQPEKENVAPHAFIPWVLSQFSSVKQVRERLEGLCLADMPLSPQIPSAPLHWMVSDREEAIVIESMKDGLHVYDAPAGVMTNNPPYPFHRFALNNYRGLRVDTPDGAPSKLPALDVYCQGLGALGLPGDVSSMSRFVRAAFNACNAQWEKDEEACVSQFFHLLGSVEMIRGCCLTGEGHWDITVYTSCMNADKGLYYYTTYGNRQIGCVGLHDVDLAGDSLTQYPLERREQIRYESGKQ